MKALVEGGEVVEALRERILGRVSAAEVMHPETQDPLYPAGTLLNEEEVDMIESLGIDEVKVRTPLTCDTRHGLCAKCYGRDLGRGPIVNIGEAVGVIAAQSIGEPGTAAHHAHLPHRRRRLAYRGGEPGGRQVQRHGALHRADALCQQRQGREDRDFALGRDHDYRRQRPRARAPQGALRRDPGLYRRQAGQGRAGARDLGPAYPAHHHRIRRHGEIRKRRGRHDGGEADRRDHRASPPWWSSIRSAAAAPARACARR